MYETETVTASDFIERHRIELYSRAVSEKQHRRSFQRLETLPRLTKMVANILYAYRETEVCTTLSKARVGTVRCLKRIPRLTVSSTLVVLEWAIEVPYARYTYRCTYCNAHNMHQIRWHEKSASTAELTGNRVLNSRNPTSRSGTSNVILLMQHIFSAAPLGQG